VVTAPRHIIDLGTLRIRLFGPRFRYVTGEGRVRGCGSGYRSSSRFISSHEIRARCERRLNHLRHTPQTRWRRLRSALKFPVIPKYPKCPNNFRLSAVH
jgi:hypothetical protein